MKCDKKDIPSYLHWNERKTYDNKNFFYYHKLYRLKHQGNPIEIPEAWVTAISCKWSKLVKQKHILLQPEATLGDDYNFAYVKEIKNYERKETLSEHPSYQGIHLLTCTLKHSPLPCDYSHAEILIRHRVFKEGSPEPFFDEIYTYDSWKNETAMLKKAKGRFFKELKKEFRLDMIKLLSRPSSQNNIYSNTLAFCNLVKWKNIKP